jgi:hypothetical protein
VPTENGVELRLLSGINAIPRVSMCMKRSFWLAPCIFMVWLFPLAVETSKKIKVFCFFSSEKKALLGFYMFGEGT